MLTENRYRKVKKYLQILASQICCNDRKTEDILICPSDYKTGNTPPQIADFMPYHPGDSWGSGADSHAWFRFTLHIPDEMKRLPVRLSVCTDRRGWDADNPQFLCYIGGKMRQGLDTNHTWVALDPSDDGAEVWLYGYTGPRIEQTRLFVQLVNVNAGVEKLYYDVREPLEALDYLDVHSLEYAQILAHLDAALSLLELYQVPGERFFASVERAGAYMDEVFYGTFCREQPAAAVCIGHTHIDCAWKWTLRQTREKVQRSFATVLELMSRYPEYKFMSSQAFLYQNLKEEAPDVYEQVRRRIAEGRWECEGAMWVEADCNISSGESLVRQILYGKRFFRQEFGKDNKILWLPDVFGYSAALPQILRKCGVEWFVTSKISWNETNTMPYDTFRWYGLDGTGINTYFITAQDQNVTSGTPTRFATYNGHTGAKMLAGTYRRYQQKELGSEALLPFGYGDGGGGPTAEHLELARRGAKGIPGVPQAKIGFAGDFLCALEQRIEGSNLLPHWSGELYLEFHRGTYTTMAKNKKNNRRSEFLYENAELFASIDKFLSGTPFPKQELHRGWEMILVNQFHDIVPGSSIKEVYDRSDKDYAEVFRIGEQVLTEAQQRIAGKLASSAGYAVFNPNSFPGDGMVRIEGKSAYVTGIPQKGYACVTTFKTDNAVVIGNRTAENTFFRIAFDEDMQMVSLFDKEYDREVLKKGEIGNQLRVYADYPDRYDAWEWEEYSREKYEAVTGYESAEPVDDGARRGLRIVRRYNRSLITQTIWLSDEERKIEFDTQVDWHERHVMLKAAFPVEIHADRASYEVQFGTLERPTHANTSWDAARFEVCAQKYADLSDGGYGVGLINDCKYGHDIHDGVMQLSLLRSPTDPNPEADQGENRIVYALGPHGGILSQSDTARYACFLNNPMTACRATGEKTTLPERYSALSYDCDHVICETVKEAEDDGATVIRLYEYQNKCGTLTLHAGFPATACYLCNMLEEPEQSLAIANGSVTLPIRGYEILTLKFC